MNLLLTDLWSGVRWLTLTIYIPSLTILLTIVSVKGFWAG
jgi:hypothetical protein